MKRKNILLWAPFIIILIILGAGILNHFEVSIYPISQETCGCQDRIPDHYYLIFGIALILSSIPITYYYISRKMEKKLDEHVESLSRIVNKNKNQKSNLSNGNDILKFLNPTEQKIVQILLKNNGEMLQSQIGKIGDMTKLKVHRTIKSLEERKIVEAEHYGKTNKIFLTKEIKKLLPS